MGRKRSTPPPPINEEILDVMLEDDELEQPSDESFYGEDDEEVDFDGDEETDEETDEEGEEVDFEDYEDIQLAPPPEKPLEKNPRPLDEEAKLEQAQPIKPLEFSPHSLGGEVKSFGVNVSPVNEGEVLKSIGVTEDSYQAPQKNSQPTRPLHRKEAPATPSLLPMLKPFQGKGFEEYHEILTEIQEKLLEGGSGLKSSLLLLEIRRYEKGLSAYKKTFEGDLEMGWVKHRTWPSPLPEHHELYQDLLGDSGGAFLVRFKHEKQTLGTCILQVEEIKMNQETTKRDRLEELAANSPPPPRVSDGDNLRDQLAKQQLEAFKKADDEAKELRKKIDEMQKDLGKKDGDLAEVLRNYRELNQQLIEKLDEIAKMRDKHAEEIAKLREETDKKIELVKASTATNPQTEVMTLLSTLVTGLVGKKEEPATRTNDVSIQLEMQRQREADQQRQQDREDRLAKEAADREERLRKEAAEREDRLRKDAAEREARLEREKREFEQAAKDRETRLAQEAKDREERLRKEAEDRAARLEKELKQAEKEAKEREERIAREAKEREERLAKELKQAEKEARQLEIKAISQKQAPAQSGDPLSVVDQAFGLVDRLEGRFLGGRRNSSTKANSRDDDDNEEDTPSTPAPKQEEKSIFRGIGEAILEQVMDSGIVEEGLDAVKDVVKKRVSPPPPEAKDIKLRDPIKKKTQVDSGDVATTPPSPEPEQDDEFEAPRTEHRKKKATRPQPAPLPVIEEEPEVELDLGQLEGMDDMKISPEDLAEMEKLAEEDGAFSGIMEKVKSRIPAAMLPIAKNLPPDALADTLLAMIPAESFMHTARGRRWIKKGCEQLKEYLNKK